ncbi:hypothetical protein RB195_009992 [Necator americanus]|uniref:Uncharacterized protein n=1 Tax=Necator americanus TaxID=51031 RepID=A0ABR1CX37_NECAM
MSVGARSDDGLRILENAVASDLVVANMQPCRSQHHLVVMDLKIFRPRKKRHPKTETQRIKWWNLKDRKEMEPWTRRIVVVFFQRYTRHSGEHSGKDDSRTRQPKDRGAYLLVKRETKMVVSKAKSDRYKAVYDMLDTREGERGADGALLRRSGQILERWRECYVQFCNEEFCHPSMSTVPNVESPVSPITALGVSTALAKIKSNRATGPDDVLTDVWKLLGDRRSAWLTTPGNSRPRIRWLNRVKLDMKDARLCTADGTDRTKSKTRSRKADTATTLARRKRRS